MAAAMLVIILVSSLGGSAFLFLVVIAVYFLRRRVKRSVYRIEEAQNDRLARQGGLLSIKNPPISSLRPRPMPVAQVKEIKHLLSVKTKQNLAISPTPAARRTTEMLSSTHGKEKSMQESSTPLPRHVNGLEAMGKGTMLSRHDLTDALPYISPKHSSAHQRSTSSGDCVKSARTSLRGNKDHATARCMTTRAMKPDLKRSLSDNYVGEAPKHRMPPLRSPRMRNIHIPTQSPERTSIDSKDNYIVERSVHSQHSDGVLHVARNSACQSHIRHDEDFSRDAGLGWHSPKKAQRAPETILIQAPKLAIATTRPIAHRQDSFIASIEDSGPQPWQASYDGASGLVREKSSSLSISMVGQQLTPAQAKVRQDRTHVKNDDIFMTPSVRVLTETNKGSRRSIHCEDYANCISSVIAVKERRTPHGHEPLDEVRPPGAHFRSILQFSDALRPSRGWKRATKELGKDVICGDEDRSPRQNHRLSFTAPLQLAQTQCRSYSVSSVAPVLGVLSQGLRRAYDQPPSCNDFNFDFPTIAHTSTPGLQGQQPPETPSHKPQSRKQSHLLNSFERSGSSIQRMACSPPPLIHAPEPRRVLSKAKLEVSTPETTETAIAGAVRQSPPMFHFAFSTSPLVRVPHSIQGPRPAPLRRATNRRSPTRSVATSCTPNRLSHRTSLRESLLRNVMRMPSNSPCPSSPTVGTANVAAELRRLDSYCEAEIPGYFALGGTSTTVRSTTVATEPSSPANDCDDSENVHSPVSQALPTRNEKDRQQDRIRQESSPLMTLSGNRRKEMPEAALPDPDLCCVGLGKSYDQCTLRHDRPSTPLGTTSSDSVWVPINGNEVSMGLGIYWDDTPTPMQTSPTPTESLRRSGRSHRSRVARCAGAKEVQVQQGMGQFGRGVRTANAICDTSPRSSVNPILYAGGTELRLLQDRDQAEYRAGYLDRWEEDLESASLMVQPLRLSGSKRDTCKTSRRGNLTQLAQMDNLSGRGRRDIGAIDDGRAMLDEGRLSVPRKTCVNDALTDSA